jgi:hypothetical protein
MFRDDDEYLDSLPPCSWCGCGIHEHCKDSEPAWMCPPEFQIGSRYGCFTGGDPRDFFPDAESCTPKELANWQQACDLANLLDSQRTLPCPSGYVRDESGKVIAHITRVPFGIGVQNYPPSVYTKPT